MGNVRPLHPSTPPVPSPTGGGSGRSTAMCGGGEGKGEEERGEEGRGGEGEVQCWWGAVAR